MSKVKKFPLYLMLFILLVFIGIPVYRFFFDSAEDTAAEPGVLVETVPAGLADFENILRYPGTITPQTTTVVTPKLSGEVLTVHVSTNQMVEAGDLLFTIDDSVARLQAEQARAGVRAAQAQLERAQRGARAQELESARASVEQAREDLQTARSNLERTERLYEAGTIARSQFEEAQNAFRNARTQVENAERSLRIMEEGATSEDLELARANVQSAQKQLELAELQLRYALVRAPVRGLLADVMIEEGSMAGTTTPLAAIIADEMIQVQAAIPEERYGLLAYRAGEMQARVYPAAYPEDPAYEGILSMVSSVIQPESRSFGIEIAVENSSGRLRPGMFVNFELILERMDNAVSVPATAVLFREGRQVVYIADFDDDGATVARIQPVKTGIRDGSRIQIISGVEAGDEIIVRGASFLEDAQLIRIREGRSL
ncbi:efflux RND transporter periplasmic adaptor subunit [Spirochaeta dissipatitropha]